MIVVDTSAWSLAFRRRHGHQGVPRAARLLRSLVEDKQTVGLPGIVLQEVLSGLRHEAQLRRLREVLDPFPSPPPHPSVAIWYVAPFPVEG